MAEEKKLEMAKGVYKSICRALDSFELKYDRDDEKMSVYCGVRGEDLPIDLAFHVYSDIMVVSVLSQLPYKASEDKKLDIAIALAAINNSIIDGCFDLNVNTGTIVFRVSYSYNGCELSEKVYKRMIELPYAMVDQYNDKLLMLSKGLIDLEQFLSEFAQ